MSKFPQQEKIQSQKMYIEAMKADRDGDTASARSFGSWASGSQASMIRRIGESGRSNKELEKTISLLKKVVEKKQAEVSHHGVILCLNIRLWDIAILFVI